jgi:integrase
VLPAISKLRVSDVTRQDIARWHHARRAAPVRANNALAVATTLFNFAEQIGQRPENSNPCRHIDRYPQRQRERILSADELARLGAALADYNGSPFVVAAVWLLVFTGARLGEILGLQ